MGAPALGLDLAVAVGPSSTSNAVNSGAKSGVTLLARPDPTTTWSAWLPWLAVAGVGVVAALLIYKMRRA